MSITNPMANDFLSGMQITYNDLVGECRHLAINANKMTRDEIKKNLERILSLISNGYG